MRKLGFVLFLMVLMLVAAPVYAQGSSEGTAPVNWAVPIAAGIGMAIASGLCGLGQGKAAAGAYEALARNPGARAGIQLLFFVGLGLIESLALYTLLIIFVKVK